MKRKLALAAVVSWGLFAAVPAGAVALCDCCAAPGGKACASACAERQEGFCAPLLLPEARQKVRGNPLNGVSLKYLELSGLSPLQLEKVREWAEHWRVRAERRFRRALRKARRGRLSRQALARAEKRRDEAIVNYQHVIRAYRAAFGRD